MRFRKFLKPYKTRDSSFREYTILEGGNVSFDKLLCGTQLEIEEVYAYKEGAYITGSYWQAHWEDR